MQTDLPIRLLAGFYEHYPAYTPEYIIQTPGRDMWMVAAPTAADHYDLTTIDLDSRAVFTVQSARQGGTLTRRPLPRWARYPVGVLLQACGAGLPLPGIVGVVGGEEPLGPRYDYALGLTVAAMIYHLNEQTVATPDLIGVMERVRRDYAEV